MRKALALVCTSFFRGARPDDAREQLYVMRHCAELIGFSLAPGATLPRLNPEALPLYLDTFGGANPGNSCTVLIASADAFCTDPVRRLRGLLLLAARGFDVIDASTGRLLIVAGPIEEKGAPERFEAAAPGAAAAPQPPRLSGREFQKLRHKVKRHVGAKLDNPRFEPDLALAREVKREIGKRDRAFRLVPLRDVLNALNWWTAHARRQARFWRPLHRERAQTNGAFAPRRAGTFSASH